MSQERPPDEVRVYRPRRATASPLYRIVQNTLETYLTEAAPDARTFCAEEALRRFLECGVHRFGVVRFLCRGCGADMIVAFSCRRRLCCPACDSKRASIATTRATEELLPRVPWRQWVLVLPKRLRYFVGRLTFHPAPEPDAETVRALTRRVRRKILKRMARLRAVPEAAVAEMLARPHGGFSLNGKVRVEPDDRAGLARLLSYCLRPVTEPWTRKCRFHTSSGGGREGLDRRVQGLGRLPQRVFEVNPLLCARCGIEMEPVAAIVSGEELVRLLTHLGLSVEFPKTKPARSPPLPFRGEESQIDPSVDAWGGIDEDSGDWHAA